MTNIDQFYFLGKCLAIGRNEQIKKTVVSVLSEENFNWNAFVRMASNHLVLTSVYLRFKQNDVLNLLPDELVSHLKMVYELNLERNKKIIQQIQEINRLFASADIYPIYLKGVGNILDKLYEDIGERMLGDIDILVSDDEFLKAVNLLKGEGYYQEYPFYEEDQSNTKHYPRLKHSSDWIDVEIHRMPVEPKLVKYFNYQVIYPQKKKIDMDISCFVLCDKHKAILNFMHAFMNQEERITMSVSYRNMNDLLNLSERVDIHLVFADMSEFATEGSIYADFMKYSMGIIDLDSISKDARRFVKKYNFIHQTKFNFLIYWIPRYFISRIWKAYFCNLIAFIFNKEKRKLLKLKLSKISWYKGHLKSYTDTINRNLGGR